MGRINIEIEDEIHKKVKAYSAMRGKTLIQFINESIDERLKREKI